MTDSSKHIYEKLSEPFPEEMEKTLSKGGARLTYIPVSEVITRLNRVLGVENWNSTIVSCYRDQLDPDYIVAHVRVDAVIGGRVVEKDGIGGQKIKRTKSGDIVDLGDEMKGAVSDALKKAVQQFGVGLYLARDIDAIELEYAQDEAEQQPAVNPKYEEFLKYRNEFDDDQVSQIREFWNDYSGGKPVPKAHEFTEEQLDALLVECIRIAFDAKIIIRGEEESEA
jgi:hypothetical protein